jgi:hypothetical protein
MEHKNSETVVYNNIFWDIRTGLFPWTAGQNANYVTTYNAGNVNTFHTYAIEWNATSIRWLFDGTQTHLIDTTPATLEEFRKPFHLILNLALGGAFPAMDPVQSQFPLYMNVDYVRVYQAGGARTRHPSRPLRLPTTRDHPPPGGSGVVFYQHSELQRSCQRAGKATILHCPVMFPMIDVLAASSGWTVHLRAWRFWGRLCVYGQYCLGAGLQRQNLRRSKSGPASGSGRTSNVSSNQAGSARRRHMQLVVPLHPPRSGAAECSNDLQQLAGPLGISGHWHHIRADQYQFTYNNGTNKIPLVYVDKTLKLKRV